MRVDRLDPDRPARLSDDVALRDEDFGALAYHYGTRRLLFLTSRRLVAVVRDLPAHGSVAAAVAAHVDEPDRDRYVEAVARLCDSGVIEVLP